MRRQTVRNGAPVWQLTKTAVAKGRQLARKYDVDSEAVVLALYLAHIKFDKEVGGPIQKDHMSLSAESASKYLEGREYPKDKIDIVLEAIRDHHKPGKPKSLLAEVMKNAECYKFITWSGTKIYYDDLIRRGYSRSRSDELVRLKFQQKKDILTFSECIAEAERNYLEIDRNLKLL